MSIFELKECDVVSTVYTALPDYGIHVSGGSTLNTSDPIYIFSSSVGLTRDYRDINNDPITGSLYNLSGVVVYDFASELTTSEKRTLERLRKIYALNSFLKNAYTGGLLDNWYERDDFSVVFVPSVLFGTEMKPGSVTITVPPLAEQLAGEDDSYGTFLNESGNPSGYVFYQHGIILISGSINADIRINFTGTHKIPVNIYNCRVPRGGLNFSNNPSYISEVTASNRNEVSTKDPKTFITSVQLYDKNYDLVGEAKVSNPILNEEDTGLLFKLKLNF